jgi:hypothetical protein
MDYVLRTKQNQQRGVVMVNNADGVQRKNFSRETVKKITDAVQNAIPVRMAGMYLCNMGMMFNIIFPIVKLFLKEKMKKRMNKIDNIPDLLKYFPSSDLPTDLEGEMVNDHSVFVTARMQEIEAGAMPVVVVPVKKKAPAKVVAM